MTADTEEWLDSARAGIIGAGQAGAAFAFGLVRIGVPVAAVASRSSESARRLAGRVDAAASDLLDAVAASNLVFLTTPDGAMPALVESLAADADLGGKRVLHCSGILDLGVLAPAADAGARIGILHPVTPLVPPEPASTLVGKPMGCEPAAPSWVADLAVRLGGKPVDLEGVNRPLYHAAASMSANLVVAMAASAVRAFRDAGIAEDDAEALVGSLLSTTAAGVCAHGPEATLTGPVRRGDAGVVRSHLDALAAVDPELAETYRVVSRRILDLMAPGEERTRSAKALDHASPEDQ